MMSFAEKMDATGDYPIKWNESASERQTACFSSFVDPKFYGDT